jgi:hypothetical protein
MRVYVFPTTTVRSFLRRLFDPDQLVVHYFALWRV